MRYKAGNVLGVPNFEYRIVPCNEIHSRTKSLYAESYGLR